MSKNDELAKLQTLGEIAIELGVPYRRLRYLTHMRGNGKLIKPFVKLGAAHFYGPDQKREILAELERIAKDFRDKAARRKAAVPA